MQEQASSKNHIKLTYLRCKEGNLHQGQVLNFICMDAQCKNKGLICAVCRQNQHINHKAIHVKTFLSEIQKSIEMSQAQSKPSNESYLNLNDQLRSIERSKRQMQKTLHEMVKQLCQKVKETQKKINDSYIALRKILLVQSTSSAKLPQLYKLFTDEEISNKQQREELILKSLKGLSQIIEYKDNKIHTVDSSHKLIEEYSKTASSISIHLSTIIPEISKKLATLPLKVKSLRVTGKQGGNDYQSTATNFVFSENHKSESITLRNQKKQAYVSGQFLGGLAFIDQSTKNSSLKISFRIKSIPSYSIMLGIGNPSIYKQKEYLMDEGSFDLFAISSVGFPLNDYDNPSFVFAEGDVIDTEWNISQRKLSFKRRNGIEQFEMFPQIDTASMGQLSQQRFFVGLTAKGDCVEIIDIE